MSLFAHGRGSYPASDVVYGPEARTASPNEVEIGTTGAHGLIVVINVSAATDTPSVVFSVKGVVYPSGKTPGATAVKWTILESAAITGTGTTVLQVAPELGNAANELAEHLVPDLVEISAAHADADSITYSVTAILTA